MTHAIIRFAATLAAGALAATLTISFVFEPFDQGVTGRLAFATLVIGWFAVLLHVVEDTDDPQ